MQAKVFLRNKRGYKVAAATDFLRRHVDKAQKIGFCKFQTDPKRLSNEAVENFLNQFSDINYIRKGQEWQLIRRQQAA